MSLPRVNIYRVQLEGMDRSLSMGERFYVGHLLDHARLTKRDKAMIRTRAGDETENNITTAMLDLAAELEGESGYPIGMSEPNAAGANGEEFLVQRAAQPFGNGRRGYGKPALAADVVSTSEGPDDDRVHDSGEEPGEDSMDEDIPNELVEVEREAYALQYKAKQKIAELKKMRNYYKKADPEERRRALAEKIKNTHCHACGEMGHWAKECPKGRQQPQQQAFMVKYDTGKKEILGRSEGSRRRAEVKRSSRAMSSSLTGVPEATDEWDLLVSLCTDSRSQASKISQVYMALPCTHAVEGHEVLWNINELSSSVILDLGCMKSVAGTKWVNQLLQRWKSQGRWFKVNPERETFRFGSGHTLDSRYEIQFQATFAQHPVILAFSVVEGDCPPLMSKPACSILGAIFDTALHTLSSRVLKVKAYGLSQTLSGHYIMNVEEFEHGHAFPEIPEDFCMPHGQEVHIWMIDEANSKLKPLAQSHPVHGVRLLPESAALQDMRRPSSPQSRLPGDSDRRGVRGPDSEIYECDIGDQSHTQDETTSRGRGKQAVARSSSQGTLTPPNGKHDPEHPGQHPGQHPDTAQWQT